MNWLAFVLLVILSYFLGSFPTGVVLGRWIKGVDIRDYGSGKTGATNSLRTLGWKISLTVFVIDIIKGGLSVFLPVLFFTDAPDNWLPWVRMFCGLACMLGHDFSIWIKFKGGRGVAVGLGELLVAFPLVFLLAFIITVPIIAVTKYVSLGSVLGALITMILVILQIVLGLGLDPRYLGLVITCASLVLFMHRDNIIRLVKGTERKLGDKGVPASNQNIKDKEKAGKY